ncbi:MAG: aldo/keto reductase [Bryobacteraceae bacterium]|jgi:aryl-alcohol dehydrogenase-like predicted oxidoreductase
MRFLFDNSAATTSRSRRWGSAVHHLGDAPDQSAAVRLVRQAVDGGITFFDNCWEYHRGKTEVWMGAGLKGVRDRYCEGRKCHGAAAR